MVWNSQAPQGHEAAKVKLDLVPYMRGVVLDLGCGPAKIFNAPNVVGIDDDRDAEMFGIKSNPDMRADCTRLPFVDGYADTVFSAHLLEHVEDYKAVLAEWWRLVKPGGHLILYLPHADHYPNIGMPGANPDHKHDFRNADITAAMREVATHTGYGWDQLADEVRSQTDEYSLLQIYRKRTFKGWQCDEFVPKQKPEKTLGIVRLGANGDALWLSALLPQLKDQGYHITVYTQEPGELALRHDPNIDRLIVQPKGLFGVGEADDVRWQVLYWLHEEKKYNRFINFTGCIERDLLAHPSEFRFYFSHEQRQRLMNRNYMEALHECAGLPYDRERVRVRFYPSADEAKWAAAERAKYGRLVIICQSGSSLPKFWPHAQRLMELLDARGVHSIVVGDVRGLECTPPPRGQAIGMGWDIRKVYALAARADVVVGVETAVLNSVAHEPCGKIALLSHSSAENLTRDWHNTIALEPRNLHCYPCHRIHADASHCNMPRGYAACQDGVSAEAVADMCMELMTEARAA